jgi:GNAT superfamily N-acetyltransferase
MPVSGEPEPSAASIAPLGDSQLQPMAELIARAFSANPLNRAVIRSADPERCFRSNLPSMRMLIPIAHRHGQVLAASLEDKLVGGLVAAPPGRFPLPPPPLLGQLQCLARQGWRVARRWQAVFEALEVLHPAGPHWYLAALGVADRAQRRGVGAALLSRWLEGVDRDAVPAYLETDREQNLRLYERAGFSLTAETSILGARIWQMKRPPASGRHSN